MFRSEEKEDKIKKIKKIDNECIDLNNETIPVKILIFARVLESFLRLF